MRRLGMVIALAALTAGAVGCGHETRTVVRRETVQTEVPAPKVIERTIIEPEAMVPQQRVYEERRTTIEHE